MGVTFRRIRGRIVPIKTTKEQDAKSAERRKQAAKRLDVAVQSAFVGGAASAGTFQFIKRSAASLGRRADRLNETGLKYGTRAVERARLKAMPAPTKGKKKLPPDMFDRANAEKARRILVSKTKKLQGISKQIKTLKTAARFLRKHNPKIAIAAGIGAAAIHFYANDAGVDGLQARRRGKAEKKEGTGSKVKRFAKRTADVFFTFF